MARPETGPMQAEDDWPGLFIRGDNALMAYAPALEQVIKIAESYVEDQPQTSGSYPQMLSIQRCQGLLSLLNSVQQSPDMDPTMIKVLPS